MDDLSRFMLPEFRVSGPWPTRGRKPDGVRPLWTEQRPTHASLPYL